MPKIDPEKQRELKRELAEVARQRPFTEEEKRLWEVLAQASLQRMTRKIEELFAETRNG